ncbi:MAG TPA: hypothetical protein P5572_09685 [Phycisphaerae bacterium]|nr:hypothetical protein [Phycisphaerae bacterium]
MMDPWPFEDPPGAAAHTTRQVLERVVPIVRVTRDPDDGSWQFWDGGITPDRDNRVLSLEDVVRLDPTVAALADLPLGWTARRDAIGDAWERERHPCYPHARFVMPPVTASSLLRYRIVVGLLLLIVAVVLGEVIAAVIQGRLHELGRGTSPGALRFSCMTLTAVFVLGVVALQFRAVPAGNEVRGLRDLDAVLRCCRPSWWRQSTRPPERPWTARCLLIYLLEVGICSGAVAFLLWFIVDALSGVDLLRFPFLATALVVAMSSIGAVALTARIAWRTVQQMRWALRR